MQFLFLPFEGLVHSVIKEAQQKFKYFQNGVILKSRDAVSYNNCYAGTCSLLVTVSPQQPRCLGLEANSSRYSIMMIVSKISRMCFK